MMLRFVLAILATVVVVEFATAQWNYAWHCGNRRCRMCNTANANHRASQQAHRLNTKTPQVIWTPATNKIVLPPNPSVMPQPVPDLGPDQMEIEIGASPTPHAAVTEMLKIANPRRGDVLFDPGCGDGRILIQASRDYGLRTVGIEHIKSRADRAKRNLTHLKCKDFEIVHGDAATADYSRATIVLMYLFPDTIAKIIPRLKPGTVVVSYLHDLPGVKSEQLVRTVEGEPQEFYLYEVPKKRRL